MPHRKRFPPLPDFARGHPKALEWRVDRIEDHLESHPSNSEAPLGLCGYIPAIVLWLLGLVGLVSPETAASALKALGH